MTVRRCKCVAVLALVSVTVAFYFITRAPSVPRGGGHHLPQALHETQLHRVKAALTEELDSGGGMYDEIELTKEDLQLAADKRASLARQSNFVTNFKHVQDMLKETAKVNKGPGAKSPAVLTRASDEVTSTQIVPQINPPPKVNVQASPNPVLPVPVTTPANDEKDLKRSSLPGKSATKQTDQTYGIEIIAEPSQVEPPPNEATASKRQAKVRNAYLSPKVVQQLQHIQSVGQQLHDMQTYMQDDRIYYQYHKNKSRQSNLSEQAQQVDKEREGRVLDINRHISDIQIPMSPPVYEHGYPIEFQSASYIPSGQEPHRPKPKDRHEPKTDTSGREQQSPPLVDNIRGGGMLPGDLNAVPNEPSHLPERLNVIGERDELHGQAVVRDPHSGNIIRMDRGSNRPKPSDSTKEKIPNMASELNSAGSKNSGRIAMLPSEKTYTANAILQRNAQSGRAKIPKHLDSTGDISDTEKGPVPTVIPTPVFTTPIRYEQMTNGDLTVHHTPDTANQKQKSSNGTEAQGKKGLNDEEAEALAKALTLSNAFLRLMANSSSVNDTVAAVSGNQLFQKPASVQRVNSLWQVHQSPQAMYLYSAYYDDRPALDRHKIRIIGIANADVKNPHCLLWYPNISTPDLAMAVLTKIGPRIMPVASSSNRYEPYIFTCSLLPGKGAPKQVSMITIRETKPTTLLNVQVPVKPPPEEQLDIGQCMSVVYWHQDPTRLIEWLELNRIWGIGEITVYGNELSDATTAVFTDYARQGLVDFRQMPNILDDDSEFTILLNMSPAINDCMYRNMYRYKKVLCTDVDEMVVPRAANNYTEMMQQIIDARGSGHPHPSFMFRNVYFFTDFGPHVDEPWFLHSQRYLKHIKPSEFGYSVKSITDPQACIALQNHLCWKRIRKYDHKNWTIDVPLKYGRNQHYKTCHFDSYLGQLGACDRMMKEYFVDYNIERFGPELYDRVAQKLVDFRIAEAAATTVAPIVK